MREEIFNDQIINLDYLEQLYQQYRSSPDQVNPSWQKYFHQLEKEIPRPVMTVGSSVAGEEQIKALMEAYRTLGHFQADINPIALPKKTFSSFLQMEKFGFSANDLQRSFPTLGLFDTAEASLSDIIHKLDQLYCNGIGFDYKGENIALKEWFSKKINGHAFEVPFNPEEKKHIFDLLNHAEFFETFLHIKHVGKKRFSLEGAETLIPMLSLLVAEGAQEGVQEFVIGMSHRGRLNVLANVLHKHFTDILRDFDDACEPSIHQGMGDIRYHKGYINEWVMTFRGHKIKLSLPPNPSHLESIDPVVEGQTRAKQILLGDEVDKKMVVPILMHGDAAISGQGVVYETMQLSQLLGYDSGGTIHIVINNQLGFTANPEESRSTHYCTDIAYTFGSPVLHLNSEKIELCIKALLVAFEMRQKFHCDVFLDLYCYRKHGHNEGDEPTFTQPKEYQSIKKKQTLRELYREQLIHEGVLTAALADEMEEKVKQRLQAAFNEYQEGDRRENRGLVEMELNLNTAYQPLLSINTGVDRSILENIADRLVDIPNDYSLHPKVEALFKERYEAFKESRSIDWGNAEALAFGSILWDGISVRLSGQDSGRGTFSHRHAQIACQKTGRYYYPLAHLKEGQGRFEALNSCLSEVGVLAFEYGYNTIYENCLTVWEAQFGDFANSAQVVIDQYIASGEEKWGQKSGLVLFLPHGYEGQGPEHSSARIERFLSLAGHDNIVVVNPTLPVQLFHILRRQVMAPCRKPLVVFTPKGLLRHPDCRSSVEELSEGNFKSIIGDEMASKDSQTIVFCSGRVYYEFEVERKKAHQYEIVLVRIEQLYPLDEKGILNMIGEYNQLKQCYWVQEEPENMGAWSYIAPHLKRLLPQTVTLELVSRERSSTPATGFYARHRKEQVDLLNRVFHT